MICPLVSVAQTNDEEPLALRGEERISVIPHPTQKFLNPSQESKFQKFLGKPSQETSDGCGVSRPVPLYEEPGPTIPRKNRQSGCALTQPFKTPAIV
jgi:hypothetical protein